MIKFMFFLFFTTFTLSFQAGDFSVESVSYHLIDDQRKESYTNDSAYPWRELMIRVWYPADNMNKNSISSAQQKYPLLIFSHGLGGTFNGDTYETLCSACVKAGYIVVTISHSYACKPIYFSDGRITTHCLSKVEYSYLSGREIETWEADSEYVLNQCEKYNGDEHSFLYNRLDWSKIGMFGHSYGGSAAVQMCRKDDRIKAAINLDGPLRGKDSTVPFAKPLLFIIGPQLPFHFMSMPQEVWNDIGWSYAMYSQELFLINELSCSMNSDVYKVFIDGIRHTTFSDIIFSQHTPLDEPLLDPLLAHNIISSYVIDFFDVYVKGKRSSLLDLAVSPWEQVVVEKNTLL